MGDMVRNVNVKFNYDRFRIDKALGNFQKSYNNYEPQQEQHS